RNPLRELLDFQLVDVATEESTFEVSNHVRGFESTVVRHLSELKIWLGPCGSDLTRHVIGVVHSRPSGRGRRVARQRQSQHRVTTICPPGNPRSARDSV